MFVDRVTVYLRGGDGGAGVASFLKQRGKPRGRPDGGSGGRGGDVVLQVDASVSTLLGYKRRPHRTAGSGTHGSGDLRHGGRGTDLVLGVPPGTVVMTPAGEVLADLVQPGQRVVVVKGGRGGSGNAALVTPRTRAPSYAEQGEYGEQATVVLELKLMADAALVGFPNAGKSTLISAVSAARPKVADYPFTTLEPNLGVVEVADRTFVLADIPGLIEGAAEGRGLGHEFLRHVERARVLILLLDASSMQETSAIDQYRILVDELARFSTELALRPRLAALSKLDLPDVGAAVPSLEAWASARAIPLFPISGVTGAGLERFLHAVANAVEDDRRELPDREGYVLHRPAVGGYDVVREGTGFRVTGKAAERAVALDDLTSPEAARFAARRLARMGVNRALAEAGAHPGDEVRIGGLVFEYRPDDEEET